jgi:hypothetical protein
VSKTTHIQRGHCCGWSATQPRSAKLSTAFASFIGMSAEICVRLIEEMVDLKVQQHTEAHLKTTPEIANVLQMKRETDRRRLEQIRTELARMLG